MELYVTSKQRKWIVSSRKGRIVLSCGGDIIRAGGKSIALLRLLQSTGLDDIDKRSVICTEYNCKLYTLIVIIVQLVNGDYR